ncbi:MAG: hypothetical protein Tsb0020_00190 [Haliangiales bacterium]
MNSDSGHALVIGSSMAGLLAARVLAQHFGRVTLVDRDRESLSPDPRRGVPQGRHAHVLLKAGADILEQLFPGLWVDMHHKGSVEVDLGADLAWFHYGVWKSRAHAGVEMHCQSRPFLEWQVRERVRALPGVEVIADTSVESLRYDRERGRVIGVSLRGRDQAAEAAPRELLADLVVDASGRGTATPRWLAELGYPAPAEDVVATDVRYASRVMRLPADLERDWKCLVIYPRAPRQTRVGYIFPNQDGTHLITLAGYCGDAPPLDEAGFAAFARSLPRPELWQAIARAEPLSPLKSHRLPSNLWRRYDRMARFPDGYLVVGDAVCSFNPLFGQGISTAGFDALALSDQLSESGAAGFAASGSARRFQRRLVAGKRQAWILATTEDLRYPQVTGKRPPGLSVLNWYKSHFLEGATDPVLNRAFLQVLTFQRGLDAMMTPGVVARVMARAARGSMRRLFKREVASSRAAPS